ncbi:MAG: GNAT family N-acetyltransferase [Epulopiscium sp.]|nr:GNAT family N-acetyltransferase [Candidatus Epulonipiscium sp.]
MQYTIRPIKASEIDLLQDFLYEAIFQKDGEALLPKSIIHQPEIKIYIEDFGRPHDLCLVAELDQKVAGAVWTRVFSNKAKSYAYIDERTPELAISLYKEYRGQGIGTALMKKMLELLREKGYKQVSLSVQKDNYAFKMYKNLGFEIIKDLEKECIMIYHLME